MYAPTLFDLRRFNGALDGTSLSEGWRIPSSKEDDVIWNIVLAYLNSFRLSDENELTRCIKCLTEDQEKNGNIKKFVEICNPFLHRNACFNGEPVSQLVTAFRNRVESYSKKEIKLALRNFQYCEASSKLLHCNILLISLGNENKTNGNSDCKVHIFPIQKKIYGEYIVILESGFMQDYSFCIPKEIGIEKRRQALGEILGRMRTVDNKINMIQDIINNASTISGNFLISLLKSELVQVLPLIYESPYILSKLAEAGFETDPRTEDSTGKSAFFHALKTEKSYLVSLLYDHAVNAYLQKEVSVRSPDPVIVENLLCLKKYLELLGKELESKGISEKSRYLFKELCRFNEFQIEMFTNINNVNSKINYYDLTDEEYDASKRKEAMLAILKTFKSFFDYTNEASAESLNVKGNFSRLKNFCEHRYYYDKLDVSSAIMFFNNIFLLKERLLLQKNAYLNVESAFFLFLFCRKYLERHENVNYYVIRCVRFQERLLLERKLSDFEKILENSNIVTVNKIPESTVATLTNLPENYGHFLSLRLQHYSNAAIALTAEDLKSILVIERCLVVIGESCKKSDFKSVQRIFTLALPEDFIQKLKQIRNLLAHKKPHEILYRNNLEQDAQLFIGIRNELAQLKEILLPIYSAHQFEMDRFLLLHCANHVCKARRRNILEKYENQLNAILPTSEIEENQMQIATSTSKLRRKINFDFINNEINNLNRNQNILDIKTSSRYKYILQNMISAVGIMLKNLKSPVPNKDVAKLDCHFWCLESMLSYITKDRLLASHRRTLIHIIKNRKSIFTTWKKNLSTNSIIDETLEQTMNPKYFIEKHAIFIDLETGSTTFSNENENSKYFLKNPAISEKNQEEKETSEKNSENFFAENVYHCNIIQETIYSKECKETVDLRENGKIPEPINPTEKNDLFFKEAINTTSRNGWILSNVYPVSDEVESPIKILNLERKTFIEHSATFLDEYKKFTDNIFQKFSCDFNEQFDYTNINKCCLILKGHTFLNEKEKEFILQSVPEKYKNIPAIKKNIKVLLKPETSFTEIETELCKLNLKNKEIKEIKENIKLKLKEECYGIIDKARDYFLELKYKLDLNEINILEYELLCKNLEISDDAKNIFSKIVNGQNKKVPGDQIEFLRNRIKLLKNILIDEFDSIQQLWKRATTPRRKMLVKEKIVQLYLNDPEIQGSVEMLLFDCMAALEKYKLNELWKKTTNLLSGINLRNVLNHGHPLLESLGRILDPCDLPSELVEKILKLIRDENVIHCIQQILEQSGTRHSSFNDILEDEQFQEFSKKIRECGHFYEYAPLLIR